MVQLNERVWVCFEMARVQNAHAEQREVPGMAEEFLPSMQYSRITENTGSTLEPS